MFDLVSSQQFVIVDFSSEVKVLVIKTLQTICC